MTSHLSMPTILFYFFTINTVTCSLKFFFFHWLLLHSDFPSVLCLSFTNPPFLPNFKCLRVPGDHGLYDFLLTKQVGVGVG